MMITSRPPRGHYTEAEVARLLDVSLDELRALVRERILGADDDAAGNLSITCYQPSDVLLLRLIVNERKAAAA